MHRYSAKARQLFKWCCTLDLGQQPLALGTVLAVYMRKAVAANRLVSPAYAVHTCSPDNQLYSVASAGVDLSRWLLSCVHLHQLSRR
jgi:hypothetical protein